MSSAAPTRPTWDGDESLDAVLARYRDIVENANDLIVEGDLEERIVGVNTAFERTLGYSREELIGRPLASLVTSAWRVQLEDAAVAKLSGRSERTVYDLELVAKDGRAVRVEVSSWLVRENGQPTGFQAICRDVSERKEAEQVLRDVEETLVERENILQRAFENTAIGMVIVSLDGHVISANRAFADLLGYRPDELHGVDLVAISHPEDRHAAAAVIPRLLAGRATRVSIEKRYLRKDGTHVWVQIDISPVRNGAGDITCFVSQVVDVTAKRDAAAVVRRARSSSARPSRTRRSGCSCRRRTGTSFARTAPSATCSATASASCGGSTSPSSRIRTTGAQRRTRSSASVDGDLHRHVTEKRYLRKDGRPVWVQIAVSAVRGADGKVKCHVTQVVDLTARREFEQRFRLLFESSPHGMDIIDADGRMLQANSALLHMLGYEREELLALRFEDFTHPEDVSLDRALFDEMLAGERPHYELEKRCLHKDGGTVWVHLTSFALPDSRPTPRFAIGILEDVTERRQLEEQLRQSQRMEAIGRLAGGVAHDFNNLLTAITSYCDLAEDGREDPSGERRTSIGGIRGAADRAAELTQQLLAFSRRQVLELTPLDVNAVVSEHAPMLQRLLGEDVAVVLSLDPDVATVTMDAGQLVQVLMNLAVNARDAMPDGGTLTIESENVELDCAPTTSGCVSGPHVLLAVSDTGSGIDAETQARMFEPFFTTKETGKGTGLGLSTVLGIVEQSGGRLSVYSEPGVGTTFKIYMPSLAGTARSDLEAPAAAGAGERPSGCERILLVEDNDAVRDPLAAVLADLGYDVIAAPGPEEALRLAAGAEIDLLVTDVVMPAMNGRQLAERLLPDHEGMHVLYISGYTDDAVIARGVIDPGTAFLQKPFGADRLALKIRELLDA